MSSTMPSRASWRRAAQRLATWYTITTVMMNALQDDHELPWHLRIWSADSPRDRTPQKIAANTMPIGLFCPRNATAMPVNRAATRSSAPGALVDEQLLHADEAGERARDEEELQLHPADRDAAGLGGPR